MVTSLVLKSLGFNMMNFMMVSNEPEVASLADSLGVSRIFIDLEINGKQLRQGHRDTFISAHKMSDVAKVRPFLSNSELLVRLNPLYEGSKIEVDEAIKSGADILMLPMFRTAEEVREFSGFIGGRVKFIPLVETKDAALNIADIVKVKGITEIFIGLNDLHVEYGLGFMFELISNGTIDMLVKTIKKSGLPFGFGGVARVGEGAVPAEIVLAEHLRLSSTAVILSRSFRKDGMHDNEFESEINKLKTVINDLQQRSQEKIELDRLSFVNCVQNFVARKCL